MSLADILHRIVNATTWNSTSERDGIHADIDAVLGEPVAPAAPAPVAEESAPAPAAPEAPAPEPAAEAETPPAPDTSPAPASTDLPLAPEAGAL